jgi:hypothetical protein
VLPQAASAATGYSDNDILNFALNLEYLEANFYYLAAFGTTIDVSNTASTSAGAPLIVLNQTVGTKGTVNTAGAGKVPFTSLAVGAYAVETAVEEGKHVRLLQTALGSLAVAQPALNLSAANFAGLAALANVANGSSFTPYAGNAATGGSPDAAFLVGAYIFEDVGVTAYHGAASLIVSSSVLTTAAGILAVEAYHAGLVRTTINSFDANNANGYLTATNQISALRASLAMKALIGASGGTYDANPDDNGLVNNTVLLGGATTPVPATRITDADPTNVIAYSRNTAQIVNIVTAGGKTNGNATALVTVGTGGFFPSGLNGLFQ